MKKINVLNLLAAGIFAASGAVCKAGVVYLETGGISSPSNFLDFSTPVLTEGQTVTTEFAAVTFSGTNGSPRFQVCGPSSIVPNWGGINLDDSTWIGGAGLPCGNNVGIHDLTITFDEVVNAASFQFLAYLPSAANMVIDVSLAGNTVASFTITGTTDGATNPADCSHLDSAQFTCGFLQITDLAFDTIFVAQPLPDTSYLTLDNLAWNVVQTLDSDGDDTPDEEDNCPNDANSDQADLDEDGLGDVCDDDADGDGELPPLDCNDLDPGIFTTAIEICTDGIDNDCDLLVDAADDGGDCDGDTVPNGLDNCPDDANPGQADHDNDGIGDVCDPDDDNDGYDDDTDNCPVVANNQADLDLDGVGDACDADADGDSVDDLGDLCLSTAPSDTDAGVPNKRLGKNRWADIDGDGLFDTSGNNPTGRYYAIDDTAGCNCAQIIEACGYGQGHTKHGCSNSVMDWWAGSFDREGELPYQCKD